MKRTLYSNHRRVMTTNQQPEEKIVKKRSQVENSMEGGASLPSNKKTKLMSPAQEQGGRARRKNNMIQGGNLFELPGSDGNGFEGYDGADDNKRRKLISNDQESGNKLVIGTEPVGGVDGMNGLGYNNMNLMSSNQQQILTPPDFFRGLKPLGLKLTITPSLVNQIERELSKRRNANLNSDAFKASPIKMEPGMDVKRVNLGNNGAGQSIYNKSKISNFSAHLLKIGSWKRDSQYEGDLEAKFYYATRKLIWEVVDSAELKSKIEIKWSDISAIRATFQENGLDILEVELSQPPLFFRASITNPKKHPIWHAISDFTEGQAPLIRRHYLQFPQGTLEGHYKKLLLSDDRLCGLSLCPFSSTSSPYFSSHGGRREDCLYENKSNDDNVQLQNLQDQLPVQDSNDYDMQYLHLHPYLL